MVNLDNLFKRIKDLKTTAKKISEATGISSGNISDWKSGRSYPTAIKLDILADYLDCSVDYLLGRTDNPNVIDNPQTKNTQSFETFGEIIEFLERLSKTYGIEFKIIERNEPLEVQEKDDYSKSCNITFPLYDYGYRPDDSYKIHNNAKANIHLSSALSKYQEIQDNITACLNNNTLTDSQKKILSSSYEDDIKRIYSGYKIEDFLALEDIWALRDSREKAENNKTR